MASVEFTVNRSPVGRPEQVTGQLTGIAEAFLGASLEAAEGAIAELSEEVLGIAKDYVPVDEGTLQASGTYAMESSPTEVESFIGFGAGAARGYAAYIHETPDKMFGAETQVRRARQGRGYKFLERAGQEIAATAEERVAESIRARIGGRPNGDPS